MEPRYLGDGVYASVIKDCVVLTTGNHNPQLADQVIIIDDEVRPKLAQFMIDYLDERKRNETN